MMEQSIVFALEAAENGLAAVDGGERADATRLVQMCREHFIERRPDEGVRVREASQLVELLARRSARAMPYAALGRALIADLKNDETQLKLLIAEFQLKLSQLGL